VEHGPALQEMLGEFGVFVEGGIEQALVGGEDDDERKGGECFLQGLKPNSKQTGYVGAKAPTS
jgi:hypothetical protein